MIGQIIIALCGVTAIWLANDADPSRRRYACLFGLAAQPAWFYVTWTAGQYGIFALSFLYALSWFRGFRRDWGEDMKKLLALTGAAVLIFLAEFLRWLMRRLQWHKYYHATYHLSGAADRLRLWVGIDPYAWIAHGDLWSVERNIMDLFADRPRKRIVKPAEPFLDATRCHQHQGESRADFLSRQLDAMEKG